jgi:hypothetical protein
MLGQSPEELQRRFLKYLKERYPEKIRAMRVLALALYFDGRQLEVPNDDKQNSRSNDN